MHLLGAIVPSTSESSSFLSLLLLDPEGQEPVPNSPLLYVFSDSDPTADELASVANGSATNNNAVLHFEKGKKYRLRVINMSGTVSILVFTLGSAHHQLAVGQHSRCSGSA